MERKGGVESVELDLRGQVCPATLLKSLRKINELKSALRAGTARLSIYTDNRYSTDTVSDAAMSMGYRVSVVREESHYRIGIEAKGAES